MEQGVVNSPGWQLTSDVFQLAMIDDTRACNLCMDHCWSVRQSVLSIPRIDWGDEYLGFGAFLGLEQCGYSLSPSVSCLLSLSVGNP